MQNYEDEEVVRLILFRKDFCDAIVYFEKSKEFDDILVRDSLIKIGIISYAKPFMKNSGIHKEAKGYCLYSSFVKPEHEWIHQMLLDYRGNFIGHSNFNAMKPSMSQPQPTPKGEMLQVNYIDLNFAHWFEANNEFSEPPLIEKIIQMVTELMEAIPKAYKSEEVFPEL